MAIRVLRRDVMLERMQDCCQLFYIRRSIRVFVSIKKNIVRTRNKLAQLGLANNTGDISKAHISVVYVVSKCMTHHVGTILPKKRPQCNIVNQGIIDVRLVLHQVYKQTAR